jgi:hypothetical protein
MNTIEGLNERMSSAVARAWKKDPLYTPNPVRAGKQHLFMLTCARDKKAPVITLPLFPAETPDTPLVIAGVCAIGEKPTVIFRQTDTVGQTAVAVETLRENCKHAHCDTNGCALLGK